MDCSKLGAAVPSAECCRRIQSRYGDTVHLVVDACQMRLSRTRLRGYLDLGCLVLISGSKFFTGPAFSGALLVPAGLAARIQSLPPHAFAVPGLRDYTSRSAWPQAWGALRTALPDRPNIGQSLRWAAALAEMRAFFAVPAEFRRRTLEQFAGMATGLFQSLDTDFTLLEDCTGRAGIRTIFPFLVRQGSAVLSYADAAALHTALAADHCLVGQPVRIPLSGGRETGALRISADARLVSRLWAEFSADPSETSMTYSERELNRVLARTKSLSEKYFSERARS